MVTIDTTPQDPDAVLREVFNLSAIDGRTELQDRQIESINRMISLGLSFGSPLVISYAKEFMILQKSRNRNSMKEFVEVVQAKRSDEGIKNRNLMSFLTG